MLRKLVKYEFKATRRAFLPLFLAMLLLALLSGIFMGPNVETEDPLLTTLRSIALFVYIMLIFSLFVVALVITIQRFYKNLTGDEGYLMFTLPVKSSSLIWSKLIVAVVWEITSIIVILVSVLLLFVRHPEFYVNFSDRFQWFWAEIRLHVGTSLETLLWFFLASLFVAAFVSTLQIYASIAIGQLFREHRVLFAIGSYFGISIVIQIVTSLLSMLPFISKVTALTGTMETTAIAAEKNAQMVFEALNASMPGLLALDVILGVAFFLVTNYIFKKKLNLE